MTEASAITKVSPKSYEYEIEQMLTNATAGINTPGLLQLFRFIQRKITEEELQGKSSGTPLSIVS